MTKLPVRAPGARRLCQSGEWGGLVPTVATFRVLGLAGLLRKAHILELRKLSETAKNGRTAERLSVGRGLANGGLREGDLDESSPVNALPQPRAALRQWGKRPL